MGRGPAPYDPVVDAEIVLYKDSGWSYESIGSFFGISPKTAERRYRKALQRERGRMEAVRVHLQAGVEQGRFIHARNLYLKDMEEDKEALKRTMSEALKNEKALIESLLEVSTTDSSVGYESSSQYFYIPLDLLEAYASACYAERWVEQLK